MVFNSYFVRIRLYRKNCTEKTLYRMLCTGSVQAVCTGSLYRPVWILYRLPVQDSTCTGCLHRSACTDRSVQTARTHRACTEAPVQPLLNCCTKLLYKTALCFDVSIVLVIHRRAMVNTLSLLQLLKACWTICFLTNCQASRSLLLRH